MTDNLGHIGSRMAVARHVLGKTVAEVALLLGVSTDSYRRLERGDANSLKMIDEIAAALCVSRNFLLRGPIELIPQGALSYRRKVSLKSPGARHIQGFASMVSDWVPLVEDFVQLPPVTVPFLPVGTLQDVESATRHLREQLHMPDAPLRDAMGLVESMGILVFFVDAPADFDGVSFWHPHGRPIIILNRNQKDGYRVRFSVLHELGHLICHRSGMDRHEEERKTLEGEANLFASSFLLPASSFAKRFPRHGSLYDLLDDRSYWKVSCAAMVHRARQLQLIDADRYRRLNVSISAKGWRRGEPNSPLPETSRIHQFFLDEAGEFGLTTTKLADSIDCPPGWFAEAFPQSDQYQMALNLSALD